MKRKIKSTFVVVAVAASCLGSWNAFRSYCANENPLLLENVEALSDGPDYAEQAMAGHEAYKGSVDCHVYRNEQVLKGKRARCKSIDNIMKVCILNACML